MLKKIIHSSSGLTTSALMLLIVGAIDSIRNLPATALFGSSLIFFFIFSALIFLIPAALVSAELSSLNIEKGGIYHWISLAFGEKIGFLAVWLQWINTMVWFPTILSFIAGTATYFIDPSFIQNKIYLIGTILSLFWLMTWLNLKGLNISVFFANFCSLFGMLIPMLLIITLAIIWIIAGKPLQIHFTMNNIIPTFSHAENWISLTAIMASFLGIELATVHVKEVHQPQTTFPKALFFSVLLILITMIAGSLSIALILPKDHISLVNGVIQAFSNFFTSYHLAWLIPVITFMILIGSLGNMISWVISPAKGLLQAAQSGYLPKRLTQLNKQGVASHLLILQAILVSLICLAFLLMPSVNGAYWLLTALSTQLYMLMYVLMFCAAICLRYKLSSRAELFKIPGGNIGLWLTCLLGLMGCGITLIVGFIPPEGINVKSFFHYEMIFSSGMIVMVLPVLFFWFLENKK